MTLSIEFKIDKRIVVFLRANTHLTISTCNNNSPYSASCFYAYSQKFNSLVIKSKETTEHVRQALSNNNVSGTINPDRLEAGRIKGIQFQGIFSRLTEQLKYNLQKTYYSRFPFAATVPGSLWMIEFASIKMTDYTLGFGNKLIWNKHG